MKITEQYEALPKIAKILLQVFLGGLIGGIYRILRYLETKNMHKSVKNGQLKKRASYGRIDIYLQLP